MTIPLTVFSALILICLVMVIVAPLILLALWVIDWKRGSLW